MLPSDSFERRGNVSALQPEQANICWDPGGTTVTNKNDRLYALLSAANASDDNPANEGHNSESRMELDSHANMAVVGRHAYTLADAGKTVEVSPFTPAYNSIRAKLIDAAVQYQCPFSGEEYIFVIRDAIQMPSMDHSLVPPFMLREAGIQVNERAKIHTEDPSPTDHAIIFPETGLTVPLSLYGIFSYFPTTTPTQRTLSKPPDVYMLTPTTWNPHSDSYAINEESILDWEGHIKERRHWEHRVVLDDIPGDDAMISALSLNDAEESAIDQVLDVLDDDEEHIHPDYQEIPRETDDITLILGSVSAVLDPVMMCARMMKRATIGAFQMSVGSTNAEGGNLVETVTEEDENDSSDDESDSDEKELNEFDPFGEESFGFEVEADLEEFMASATTANATRGVTPERLSKIWRISPDDAKLTLETTTQNSIRQQDPTLSRNYGTNDRMLRYQRINTYFYMDTFFATSKGGKSSRGNTCCQLFVTDKGFLYVVPMQSKRQVLDAMKQFAKEIGAPDAFVCDVSGEQTSPAVRKFCNDIGSTLRTLEEGTPWANKAELYIGLLKEAVRKDMKEASSPLAFWDYCVERRARINNLTARSTFKLQNSNPHQTIMNNQGDMSSLCQYGWYDWCYFRDHGQAWP